MKIKAPAKINIFLKVTSARDDGFHEIVSLMQPLTLADLLTITIEEGTGISITCADPLVPTDETNLAHKAARLFMEAAGLDHKIHIDIEKYIPVAAGLGGGSSDAASTLMALYELTGFPLKEAELHVIAAKLGSDVPFFLLRGSAIATGRGERLLPAKLSEYSYILIDPGFPISAGWAYSNLTLTETPLNIKLTDLGEPAKLLRRSVEALLERPELVVDILYNDLQQVVFARHPELNALFLALREGGADGVLMSGSGPTVFGLFLSEERADSALLLLKESLKGRPYRIILCKGAKEQRGCEPSTLPF